MPRNKNPHNAKSLSINGDVSNPIRTFQDLFHCSRLAVDTLDCGPQVRLISIEEKSKAGGLRRSGGKPSIFEQWSALTSWVVPVSMNGSDLEAQ
jgi:hypothetical protein